MTNMRGKEFDFTLWQVWWDIWQFLGVDVRPVKVIVRILLVVTLREALIKCTTSCRKEKQQNVVKFTKRQRWSLLPWLSKRTHFFKLDFESCFKPFFCAFLYVCGCLSSLKNHQSLSSDTYHSGPLRITSDSASRAFSWSSEPITTALGQPCVSWPPLAPPKQEVALTQIDITCPWQLTEPINLKWYAVCSGYIADRNSIQATTCYLIHWPSSYAQLVLIKWPEETWLRKAKMPSDSSLW